jgi:hypothetical protein
MYLIPQVAGYAAARYILRTALAWRARYRAAMGIPDNGKAPAQQQQQQMGAQQEQAGEDGLELSQLQQLAQEVRTAYTSSLAVST